MAMKPAERKTIMALGGVENLKDNAAAYA